MLGEYERKRNFSATPEPGPEGPKKGGAELTFVIQKHAATSLHYDVRLELDGVLVSWAVPKGPSLNPKDKRLAMKVEDHPLDYADFEGEIPLGQYGGGQVIVWDRGTYRVEGVSGGRKEQEAAAQKGLEKGDLKVLLEGEKLRGSWVFVHTRENQWLMIKHRDEFASEADVTRLDASVLSGRRIEGAAPGRRTKGSEAHLTDPVPDSSATLLPDSIEVMKAAEAEKVFSSPDWTFELKLDGVRLLGFFDSRGVRLVSRNGNDLTDRLQTIASELKPLTHRGCVLDGEIVRYDAEGRPNFQLLMDGIKGRPSSAVEFCVFDLLFLDGKDLRKKPWTERRELLESLIVSRGHVRVLDSFPEEGEVLYGQAMDLGLEGVVAKKRDSRYESGKRSKTWLKFKGYHSEEFWVCGYTEGKGARESSFGALVLGQKGASGLTHVGNVGGGFGDAGLDSVRSQLDPLIVSKSPFENPPKIPRVKWTKPQLLAEVRFQSWTSDHHLRFPIFLRIRSDLNLSNKTEGVAAHDVLGELKGETALDIEGHRVRVTHPERELWPGVTKRDLLNYYAAVSPALLPVLKDRPLSCVRCPDGVEGPHIFQKHWERGRPDFVETVSIFADGKSGEYILCNNLATLIWLGQMSVLELNPSNSRVTPEEGYKTDFSSSAASLEESVLNRPDYVVFDLDPHFGGKAKGWNAENWARLVEVASALREELSGMKLEGHAKTSGKSGLHVFVPVYRRFTYGEVRALSADVGQRVSVKLPGKVTMEWNIKKRPSAVFIDINQNARSKTMACAYSPRAHVAAGVSMPVSWEELAKVQPMSFTVLTAASHALAGAEWLGEA